jgi:hypothetical protein
MTTFPPAVRSLFSSPEKDDRLPITSKHDIHQYICIGFPIVESKHLKIHRRYVSDHILGVRRGVSKQVEGGYSKAARPTGVEG